MTTRSRLALALTALALFGAALFFALRTDAERATPTQRTSPALDAPQDDRVPSSSTALEPPPAPAPAVEERVTATDAPSEALARRELRGTVVLEDPDQLVPVPLHGTVELALLEGSIADSGRILLHLELTITAGAWHADVSAAPRATQLAFSRLHFGDVTATIESEFFGMPLPEDGVIELRAHVPRRSLLRVVDAESGIDLSHVVVVEPPRRWREELHHPGLDYEAGVLARELVSPLDLETLLPAEKRRYTAMLLVGAPGYAWTNATIVFAAGGERVLPLSRGGDLVVHVTGALGNDDRLRVRRDGDRSPWIDEHLTRGAQPRFAGLPPGKFRVSVEVGAWWPTPLVLASADVEIVAGVSAELALALERPPSDLGVDIGGLLIVPREWGPMEPRVGLAYLGTEPSELDQRRSVRATALADDRGGARVFSWSMTHVQVGRHELGLADPPYAIELDVPPGGRSDCELRLPPPCELVVRVIDDATREDVDVHELRWQSARDFRQGAGVLAEAERDARNRRYTIRAPCGPIDLQLFDDVFQLPPTRIDLSTGVRETTLSLMRACGFVLRVRDGDVVVPLPMEWHAMPQLATGAKVRGFINIDEDERRFQLTEPGTYTLELPKIAGYVQPPKLTIVVPPHEFVTHTVQLERERR